MRKYITIFCLLIQFATSLSAQDFVRIKGIVLTSKTKEPLSLVSIFVKGTMQGTISNSEGSFLLNIPDGEKDNSIVFSSIGYQSYEVGIAEASQKDSLVVFLKPATYLLKEVMVNYKDGRDIVVKSIANFSKNYTTNIHKLTGYYREFFTKGNKCTRMQEAAIDLYDVGYYDDKTFKKEEKTKKYEQKYAGKPVINNIRSYKFTRKNVYFTYNTFLNLIFRNPIKTTGSFLNPKDIDKFEYKIIDTLEFDKYEVYEIYFEPKEPIGDLFPFGELYIDAKTYAIIQIKSYTDEKTAKFRNPYQVNKDTLGLHTHDFVQVIYREYQNKWYLSYISFNLYGKYYRKGNAQIINTSEAYFEFFVNKIETGKFNIPTKNLAVENEDLMYGEYPSNPEFWKNYNMILNDEKRRKAMGEAEN